MTNEAALLASRPSGWHLLIELVATDLPGTEDLLLSQVMGAVDQLALRPSQRERIGAAFTRLVSSAASSEAQLRIRIWQLGSCASDYGWGFFLVEKPGYMTGSPPPAETGCVVELFLYQEKDV